MRSDYRNRLLCARKNRGAVLVEMAITLMLFMTLLLAIFEFALLLFAWSRGVEATRLGARLAVVSSPVTSLSALDCSAGGQLQVSCDGADCGHILQRMQGVMPELQPANVVISYSCSAVGYPDRPAALQLYDVSVSIDGIRRQLAVPGLLGLPLTVPMPPFTASRISEDLHTP